jgi:hypothetical protein
MAVSFMSRYLNVSGQEAIVSIFFQLKPKDPTDEKTEGRLTNRGDPILFHQTDDPDPHAASLFDDESVYAFRVLAGRFVDDVG